MRMIRAIPLFTALAGIVLSTGCQSTGARDAHRRQRDRDRDRVYDTDRRDDEEPRAREVRGTVERVDPLNHRIDLSSGERSGAFAIYYDYRTAPGREPLRFRPQDLRRGDRIRADVLPTAAGLLVEQLEVLSRGERESREDRELRDETRPAGSLRGTVRYVDTSARTVEIETSPGQGRPPRVTVQYDDATSVESQGRRLSPEDLQLGNRVEIDLRVDGGGRQLLAQRIAVVGRDQTENH